MYRAARKVKNNPALIFGSCFKNIYKKQYSNIGMIVTIEINDNIYRMEGTSKITTVGKKQVGILLILREI